MRYKYKKNQLFAKKLNVPKNIYNNIYKSQLSFVDYIKYDLVNKIPLSCLTVDDRTIVEKFGVEKAIAFDWELLNKNRFLSLDESVKKIVLSLDADADINEELYRQLLNKIKPNDFSKAMKEKYPNYVISENNNDRVSKYYNDGYLSIQDIFNNYSVLKGKRFDYHILNDYHNVDGFTVEEINDFLSSYGDMAFLINKHYNCYSFLKDYFKTPIEERKKFVEDFVKKISSSGVEFTERELLAIFSVIKIDDCIKERVGNGKIGENIVNEINELGLDYIIKSSIPLSVFLEPNVLSFFRYGIKNIIEFDNKNGHPFSKNNCDFLRNVFEYYLHYGVPNDERDLYTLHVFDNEKNDRPFNMEEFEEAIRRMLYYGPTNGNYRDRVSSLCEITGDFKEKNHDLFLSDDAPKELLNLFYCQLLTPIDLKNNPNFIPFLNEKNICKALSELPVILGTKRENIYSILLNKIPFGAFINFITENAYIFKVLNDNHIILDIDPNSSLAEIKEKIYQMLKTCFNSGTITYSPDYPKDFMEYAKEMFLDSSAPKELQDLFYSRSLTESELQKHPEYMNYFKDNNIACGYPIEYYWVINMYKNKYDLSTNEKKRKIISCYNELKDEMSKTVIVDYILQHEDVLTVENIENIMKLLKRISMSNSSEIEAFKGSLFEQLLLSDDPYSKLDLIEKMFLENHLPTIGKIFACFQILYPDLKKINFDTEMMSPTLKKSSNLARKNIIFCDLLKSALGSNNRSINSYIMSLQYGEKLYYMVKENNIDINKLNDYQKGELENLLVRLKTLYNNSLLNKMNPNKYIDSGDVIKNIDGFISLIAIKKGKISDRIVSMFAHFIGIDTAEELINYINKSINKADSRGRMLATTDASLEPGDIVKGIGNVAFLRNIFQNGSVSKEYLGSNANSDSTPLDTDVCIVSSGDNIQEIINNVPASKYGPVFFVLKNDNRFHTSRTSSSIQDVKDIDATKLELFYTGVLGESHYGIRTGFASSEIDYIISETNDPRIGLEIAANGFYIPVYDMNGKIVFTPKDYDNLREKMSGLRYYGVNEYKFSDNLSYNGIDNVVSDLEENIRVTNEIKEKIYSKIIEVLSSLGYNVKTQIDGNIKEGTIELLNTGSTGRNTNLLGDGDFDYIMRLDKAILLNPDEFYEVRGKILSALADNETCIITANGDIRITGLNLDGNTKADIDITFMQKTDKMTYSTDMSLEDRLDTIKKQDYKKYILVIANIIRAKEFFKEYEIYKSKFNAKPQGGFGGVGIENLVLQHGGSFKDTIKDLLESTKGKSFEDFLSSYYVWDFGDNHLAGRKTKSLYPHDNFTNNMSLEGYTKLKEALKEYVMLEESGYYEARRHI